MYDALIVGTDPAGALAALWLARRGRTAAVIAGGTASYIQSATDAQSLDWVGAPCSTLLGEQELDHEALRGEPIRKVTLFNTELSENAHPRFEQPPAFITNPRALADSILQTAREHGAEVWRGRQRGAITRSDDAVALHTDDGIVRGRFLLVGVDDANGWPDGPDRKPHGVNAAVWRASVHAPDATVADGDARADVVLGWGATNGIGLRLAASGRTTVQMSSCGPPEHVRSALVDLCRVLYDRGHASADLTRQAATAPVPTLARCQALDLESHVAKHTLFMGLAGGFVCRSSAEWLYPTMWSAQIAAEVVDAALGADVPQDALQEFDTRWRTLMVDHLRPSNNDVQFLLPLVLANQGMADRMGEAFFLGRNI